MALFDQTFKQHIKDELEYRTQFQGVQDTLMPHIRVTSLVQGNLYGERIDGFTLGIPDVNQINTIESFFNTAGVTGPVIGLTYPNRGKAQLVRLKDNRSGPRNLPSPGVTNVSISTQSKGGFLFKAIIQLKFYGKDQYDFIYQTFLRPGNPIAIEYGHTRPQEGLKDLNFFTRLSDKLQAFKNNFIQNKTLPSTRNSGAVVGLVSNFSVRLNEQNEYEAEIELINSLEFLFALDPKDTFLNYGEKTAMSIRDNFGVSNKDRWEPDHDVFFKTIIDDAMEDPLTPINASPSLQRIAYNGIILPNEWTQGRNYVKSAGQVDAEGQLEEGAEPAAVLGQASAAGLATLLPWNWRIFDGADRESYVLDDGADIVYISLNYFVARLLPEILSRSYIDQKEILPGLFADGGIILDEIDVKHYPDLRSTDISRIIINNENLYTQIDHPGGLGYDEVIPDDAYNTVGPEREYIATEYLARRREAYEQKYYPTIVASLFHILLQFRTKEQYKLGLTKLQRQRGETGGPLGGIFINYTIIREAFMSSSSVAEAIQKILSAVSSATGGILNLKMRFVPTVVDGDDAIRIAIYNEGESVAGPAARAKLYTFFKDNKSEAISYDFDFSLPGSVAAGVMASTFKPQERIAAGGDAMNKRFVEYGYKINPSTGELAITSMLDMQHDAPSSYRPNAVNEASPLGNAIDQLTAIYLADTRARDSFEYTVKYSHDTGGKSMGGAPSGGQAVNLQHIAPAWFAAAAEAGEKRLPDDIERHPHFRKAVKAEARRVAEADIAEAAFKGGGDVGIRGPDRTDPKFLINVKADPRITEFKDIPEDKLFKQILGYQEQMPASMKSAAIADGLYNVIPSSAKITIRLQGLDGFRFGDLFSVRNVLPAPYDINNVFMLTGYEHTISSEGWFTDIGAFLIASKPEHLTNTDESNDDEG